MTDAEREREQGVYRVRRRTGDAAAAGLGRGGGEATGGGGEPAKAPSIHYHRWQSVAPGQRPVWAMLTTGQTIHQTGYGETEQEALEALRVMCIRNGWEYAFRLATEGENEEC